MNKTLEHDDVVFMGAASDPAVYSEYGATVVAWGGAHSLESVRKFREMHIHSTGAMWCLTAKAEELHENADLREATARDILGERIVVPWLFDHTFEGTPSWWGCTNHPTFRAHIRKKVCEAMAGGADGLHVDDYLGTANSIWYGGGCYCDYCMAAFCRYLQKNSSSELLAQAGVDTFADFDYRDLVRKVAPTREKCLELQKKIPLYQEFMDCQLQLAAENVRQLGTLASEIVNRPVTLSANTGLPDLHNVVVIPYLTHMVGESQYFARDGTKKLLNVVEAYRMAETLGKPIATTAIGKDWAFVKENNCEDLVAIWIALGYACGQQLMVPHRMWCFTPEKGTHWYDGPTRVYAPLYRFVREHSELFREFTTIGPLAPPADIPATFETEAKRQELKKALDSGNHFPLSAGEDVWVFPRAGKGDKGVAHLVNLAYKPESQKVVPQKNLVVNFQKDVYGHVFNRVVLYRYDSKPLELSVSNDSSAFSVTIPELGIWGILLFQT